MMLRKKKNYGVNSFIFRSNENRNKKIDTMFVLLIITKI